MLKGYLYLSDDNSTWERLPDPESYSVKPEKVEDILTAESGRTIKVVRDSRKVTVSCAWDLGQAAPLIINIMRTVSIPILK